MADNEEKIVGSAIPKRTIKLKPANLSAAGASAPTIKLKTPAAPAPAASEGAAPVATDTAKLARRTIKLVPQSGSPLGSPAAAPATPVTPAAAPAPATATDTAKLSKRTIKLTPASGGGAPAASAPTIKLTSPAAPAPAASEGAAPVATDTAKLSKRTIKLTPASGAGASSPSAPTIKLHSPSAPSAPSAPTIKLNSPSAPSAPTIKLNSPQAATEEEVSTSTSKITRQTAPQQEGAPSGAETVKLRPQSQQTIRLTPSTTGGLQLKKPVAKTGLAAAEAPDELVQKMSSSRKQAENPVATVMCMISSIVALLILGFVCFALYAQYSNFFEGSDIDVPGLERKTSPVSGK